MGEVGAAYAACRERVGGLVRGLDREDSAAAVATCPGWSVHDVVAHLTGVVDDALAGRLEGVTTDPWTAAQVEARRSSSVADIVAEWDAKAPAFEQLLDTIGDPGRQAVADAVTHEHDVRLGLGRPGARDSDAIRIGLGFVATAFVSVAAASGNPIRVRSAGGDAFGDDAAPLVLEGEPFELLRAMTGRRSVEQLRELSWYGDPDVAMSAFTFGPFRPAVRRIEE